MCGLHVIWMHIFPTTLACHDKHAILIIIFHITPIFFEVVPKINISEIRVLIIACF